MDSLFPSSHYSRHRSNNRPFFIEYLDTRKQKREHHKQLIEIYENWQDIPFELNIDLVTFDASRVILNVIGKYLPTNEPKKDLESNVDRALSHLEAYPKVYEKYMQIF